ncbi:transcription initiation factor TFIIH subunit 3, partial [Tremellales sp. Uapishka_1]
MTTQDPDSYPSITPPSLLLLILDIHPLSWSLLATPPPPSAHPQPVINKAPATPLTLSEFVTTLMVFLNAHLASRWNNEVVVYAATAGRAKLLYPPSEEHDAGLSRVKSNSYVPFARLDKSLEEGLKDMIREEEDRIEDGDGKGLNDPPALVSALTKALCYINRKTPPPPPPSALTSQTIESATNADSVENRIMVINATPSNNNDSGKGKGSYVGLMNCVFAAQKSKIPIDILTLPPPSTNTPQPIFLQQAAYLTGGVYWRWNGRGGLLQFLHVLEFVSTGMFPPDRSLQTIYLPPPSLRVHPFAVPPQDAVDFRAVCFCHQNVVDVGFVCSVCLSIFCKPLPVCLMCKTKFPIKSLPGLAALAANIEPVPLPDIIPPLPIKKTKKGAEGIIA